MPVNENTPRQCFYIPENQHDRNGYIPSLVTEGKPGHAPLGGNGPYARPWYWGKTLEEARATAERENRGTFGLSPDETLDIILSSMRASVNGPFTTQVRDAEIRVYDRAEGTDDASDMYVLEVLGVTIRVRLITVEADEDEPARTEPYITVEAGGTFTVSVNEDPHSYGDGA